MTDPAEIAKKLTPAQVLALRLRSNPQILAGIHPKTKAMLVWLGLLANERPSDLGRAVLAALDAKEST